MDSHAPADRRIDAAAAMAPRWREHGPPDLPASFIEWILARLHELPDTYAVSMDGADGLRLAMPTGWPLREQVPAALASIDALALECLTDLLDKGWLDARLLAGVLAVFARARAAVALPDSAKDTLTLEAALAARDRQLSVATHELRTPLASIRLNLELLQRLAETKQTLESQSVAKLLEIPTRQVRRLSHMVDRLLDAAQVESERLVLHREQVDLCALAHDAADRLAELARAAGCTVHLHDCHPVVGTWDRMRLEQVLNNLLTNAIKYGGGHVEIATASIGDHARMAVSDHGPGIAAQDRERIFEPYERLRSAAREDGAGLGLYIVREIVLAHGGQVTVDERPGGGSVFTVTLPLQP